MASSLLMLLDDVTTVLDDVAVLAKVAAKKTSGVLGDDLALNAQQVTGVQAERELPVVWAVAKGSLLNKAILVPAALALSALAPWAVTPLLMFGGLFLCFEGVEKLAHKWLLSDKEEKKEHEQLVKAVADHKVDLVAFEKEKIKGAITTDFVLSAEIICITLGTVATTPFLTRAVVLSAVAVLMTVLVYGFVAGVVKLDDVGLEMVRRRRGVKLGEFLLWSAPILLKTLSVAGTVAMFMVGGGILMHGLPHAVSERVHQLAGESGLRHHLVPHLADIGLGLLAGALALAVVEAAAKLRRR